MELGSRYRERSAGVRVRKFKLGHYRWLRFHGDRGGSQLRQKSEFDGYIVSAVLGLLALLLGFTFSLAVSRFEERRAIVATQANAIGTAYLRVQLLPSPYHDRISSMLRIYVDNQLSLAALGYPSAGPLRAQGDHLLSRIWADTAAALKSPRGIPFATLVGMSVTEMIDQDAFRQAARGAHVPTEVFVVLWFFLLSAAGVLGYEIKKGEGILVACFVLALMTTSLLLILDIDGPSSGGIMESQAPMEQLRGSLSRQFPSSNTRWQPATRVCARRRPLSLGGVGDGGFSAKLLNFIVQSFVPLRPPMLFRVVWCEASR